MLKTDRYIFLASEEERSRSSTEGKLAQAARKTVALTAGAATVMIAIPTPSTNRPTTNCGTPVAVAAMIIPIMITKPPANIPRRRPNRSDKIAANGAPTIAPLRNEGMSSTGNSTHTV